MTFFEVALVGFIFNLGLVIFTIIIFAGISIIFTIKNPLAVVDSKDGSELMKEIREVRETLPFSKKYGPENYLIFFPFLYIYSTFDILYTTYKHGNPFTAVNSKLEYELNRLQTEAEKLENVRNN